MAIIYSLQRYVTLISARMEGLAKIPTSIVHVQSFGMEILVKKVIINVMKWMRLNRICILSCSELHSARCVSRTLHNSSSYRCYIYLHNCKTMQETEEE